VVGVQARDVGDADRAMAGDVEAVELGAQAGPGEGRQGEAAIRAPAIRRWGARRTGFIGSRWPSMNRRSASLAERPSSRQRAMKASFVG
jgi:hypothetical protein